MYEKIAEDWVESKMWFPVFSRITKLSLLCRCQEESQQAVYSVVLCIYSWCEYNRPFQVVDIMDSLQKELAKIQVTAPDINSIP